jgi:glutamate formiminotransferase / 5-formyltetrahydrofolate cyclo-ligase
MWERRAILECVINVSEGRRAEVVDALVLAAGGALLDLHSDADHNRSVLTLAGPDVEPAARRVAGTAVEHVDLRVHEGVHPRFGAVDVVPFVPLFDTPMDDAVAARDRFSEWAHDVLGLPCLRYGPDAVSLPELRRTATTVDGHPTAGMCAVGARPLMVAYNVWLAEPDVGVARAVAAELRGPSVRALGFAVGDAAQVSCNLIAPDEFGPAAAYDAVATRTEVARAELVGLVPDSVLAAIPAERWAQLDLDRSRTIEARLERAGFHE